MRRVIASAALAAAVVAPAGKSAAVATPATATLPPALVTLEQKMQQLQVSSDRFSMKVELGGSGLTGKGGLFGELTEGSGGKGHREAAGGKALVRSARTTPKMIPLFTGVGEQSLPNEPGATEVAVLKAKLFGVVPMEIRVVGGDGYVHEPGVARIDGGRPWLIMSLAEVSEQEGSFAAPTGPGNGATGGLSGRLTKDLETAEEVTEVGTATVDGKQTTEFAAKLNLRKVFEGLVVHKPKAVRKAFAKGHGSIDVFFGPEGMPLRTRFVASFHGFSETVEVTILAVNVPVEVSAPPASETISEAQLKALEKRRLAKLKKELKHLRKHGQPHVGILPKST